TGHTNLAKSLEDFINDLKKQHQASGKGSLEWYLQQIRELAGKKVPEEEKPKEQISSGEALAAARKSKEKMTLQEAIEFTQKTAAIETNSTINKQMIGKMTFFQYDAKTKAKIKYWDMFPLTFMFRAESNYALGMNMHYLPPVERAR